MKTTLNLISPLGGRGFLFAALVTISFATTSCQKEENITPATGSFSTEMPHTEIRRIATEETNVLEEKPQRMTKPQAVQDSIKINIIKVSAEEIN